MPHALDSYLGYIIYFWISDGDEPIHVHVSRSQQANATKFWLTAESVELAVDNGSVEQKDMKKILRYLKKNRADIIARWLARFGKGELKR